MGFVIVAMLVIAAGWYYLFHSRAAANLSGMEDAALNQRRTRLRRIAGGLMILLGIALFGLHVALNRPLPPLALLLILLAVMLLLAALLILGLVDVRLTWRMRQSRNARS